MNQKAASNTTDRIYVLDYIKAIAMISVIINHCNFTMQMENDLLFPFFIGLAVPVFIVLSGFTFSLSFHKRESLGIGHWYKKATILPKLSRFLAPFILIFILESLYRFFIVGISPDILLNLRSFIYGGYGPGGYYVPILIQMLFIFPLCYWVVRKYGFKGVLIIGAIQLIYQIAVYYIGLDDDYYKRIFLRFLIFLAGGIYLFLHQDDILKSNRNKILLVLSFLVGLVYIYVVNYQGHVPAIFAAWRRTAMPTILVVLPLMALLISMFLHKKIPSKFGSFLGLIGQASYHIYLIQMFWFYIGWEKTMPITTGIVVSLLLSITLGILFYKGEEQLRKKLKQRKAQKKITSAA